MSNPYLTLDLYTNNVDLEQINVINGRLSLMQEQIINLENLLRQLFGNKQSGLEINEIINDNDSTNVSDLEARVTALEAINSDISYNIDILNNVNRIFNENKNRISGKIGNQLRVLTQWITRSQAFHENVNIIEGTNINQLLYHLGIIMSNEIIGDIFKIRNKTDIGGTRWGVPIIITANSYTLRLKYARMDGKSMKGTEEIIVIRVESTINDKNLVESIQIIIEKDGIEQIRRHMECNYLNENQNLVVYSLVIYLDYINSQSTVGLYSMDDLEINSGEVISNANWKPVYSFSEQIRDTDIGIILDQTIEQTAEIHMVSGLVTIDALFIGENIMQILKNKMDELNDNTKILHSDALYYGLLISTRMMESFHRYIIDEDQEELNKETEEIIGNSAPITHQLTVLQSQVNNLYRDAVLEKTIVFSISSDATLSDQMGVTMITGQGSVDQLSRSIPYNNVTKDGSTNELLPPDHVNQKYIAIGLTNVTTNSINESITSIEDDVTSETIVSIDLVVNDGLPANQPALFISDTGTTDSPQYPLAHGFNANDLASEPSFTSTIAYGSGIMAYQVNIKPDLQIQITGVIENALPLTSLIETSDARMEITANGVPNIAVGEWTTEKITEDGNEFIRFQGIFDVTETITTDKIVWVTRKVDSSSSMNATWNKVTKATSFTGSEPEYLNSSQKSWGSGSRLSDCIMTHTISYGPSDTPLSIEETAAISSTLGTNALVIRMKADSHVMFYNGLEVIFKILTTDNLLTVSFLQDPLGIGNVQAFDEDQAALSAQLVYIANNVAEIQEQIDTIDKRLDLLTQAMNGSTLNTALSMLSGVVALSGTGVIAKILAVTVGIIDEVITIDEMIKNGVSFVGIMNTIVSGIALIGAVHNLYHGLTLSDKGDIMTDAAERTNGMVAGWNGETRWTVNEAYSVENLTLNEAKIHHEYVSLKVLDGTAVGRYIDGVIIKIQDGTANIWEKLAVKVLQKTNLLPMHRRSFVTRYIKEEDGTVVKKILMTGIGDGNVTEEVYLNRTKSGMDKGGQINANPGYMEWEFTLDENKNWQLRDWTTTSSTRDDIVKTSGVRESMLAMGIDNESEISDLLTDADVQEIYENQARYYLDHVKSSGYGKIPPNVADDETYIVLRSDDVSVNLLPGAVEGFKDMLKLDSGKFGYSLFNNNCQTYTSQFTKFMLSGVKPIWVSKAGYSAFMIRIYDDLTG